MASLGEYFPPKVKRAHIKARLKPGCVIRLEISFPQITKPKFLILLVTDDPEYFSFLINSEINPFIQNREHLLNCQMHIDAARHCFLSHNSYIACHEIFTIRREDTVKALLIEPNAIKSDITSDIKDQIKAAVKMAKTIDKDKKNCIIAALEK